MKKTNKLISILLVMVMLLSMAPLSLTANAAAEAITLRLNISTKVDYSDSATQYYQYDNYLYKVAYSNLKNITEVAIDYNAYDYLFFRYTKSDTGKGALCNLLTSYGGSIAKLSNLPTAPGSSVAFYANSYEAIFVNENNPVVSVTCMAVNEPVWSWNGSSATAAFTSTDGKATMTVDATIESSEQTAATCLEIDKTTYTATVTANGKTYTNEKTVDGEQGPHSFEYSGDDVIGSCTNGCGYECPHENQTGESCEICGASLHTHSFTYSASGDTITAVCENTDGNCPEPEGTLTIFAPADLYADGTAKEAVIDNQLADTSVTYEVAYSTADGTAPTTAGTYTASVTIGGATASVEFTLLNYAAKVTDKDGNELEGSPYKTFADAVTAAENCENSTLTLIDNVTLTEEQYLKSGKFTLDLNGKTLLHKSIYLFEIKSDADITIKDSGENGTIETKEDGYAAIYNYGILTVESGTIKGSLGISNRGTLNFKNGEVEAGNYSAISNSGTAYIHNGKFKSANGAAINNHSYSTTLHVYGGEFVGSIGIDNHGTAYIEGGEFTGKSYAALNMVDGTLEVTGGSFTGTDFEDGYYSGTPYGEWTVDYYEGATLILKGGEFPNGFLVDDTTANTLLAEDYYFRDADGNLINVAADAKVIEGYVKVTNGADLSEAVITLDKTEFTYTGEEIRPEVTVTVGGKVLTEGKDYTLVYKNNVNAGTATVTVMGAGQVAGGIIGGGNIGNSSNAGGITESGYTGEVTKEFTIKPMTVDIIWEGDVFYYTANSHTVTAKYVDALGNEIDVTNITNGTNTEVGTYIATAVIEDSNYITSDAMLNHSYEIKWYDKSPLPQIKGQEGENGWYTGTVYFFGEPGYQVGFNSRSFANMITIPDSGVTHILTVYTIEEATGYIARFVIGRISIDRDDPTAEITVGENKWNSFFNTITFGKFFKETQTVTITADDATSGVAKIEYFIATEEITNFENVEWTEYKESFNIQPDSKNIIYAKVTDNAGRYVIVNSDGIVLYTDSTLDTSFKDEVIYVLTKNASQSFNVNLNGNTVAYVKLGETVLGTEDYEVFGNMIIVSDEVLEPLAAGEYTITVGFNPMGETFVDGDAPAEVTIPLTVKKADVTVETSDFGKVYDGKPVTAEYKISKSSDSSPAASDVDYNEIVEYKVKGADDSTYTETAPVNAGEYTVRITVAETDKINSAVATADFTIQKKAVTVTATAPDKVYDGTTDIDISAIQINFDGIVDGDTVGYTVKEAWYSGADAGENKVVPVVFNVTGEDAENYSFPTGGEYVAPDYYVEATADITPKSIHDGFIILGDALTYNGKEQTQTVDKVYATGTLEVTTYIVSGNKATNVGVYLLTVTGTGNFTGEAKLAYEIAVDMNGLDFEKTYPSNVKSTDRERIEYVLNQVENAETDLANADKRTEWIRIKGECVELLKMIESVADKLESFKNDLAKYDIDTVTSDDKDDLESFQDTVDDFNDFYFDNLTAEQEKETSDIFGAIEKLQIRISEIAKEITRITNAVNGYDKATVKSSDKVDLEKLKTDIKALSEGQNITDEERADLAELDAKLDALLKKIADTKAEIGRVNEAVNAYDEDTVKSTDKEELAQLKEDIHSLIDSGNITENEKTALGEMIKDIEALEGKIEETEEQLEEIKGIENNYNPENVSSEDKAAIKEIIAEIEAVNPDNLTDEQKAEYDEIKTEFEKLLDRISAATAQVDAVGKILEAFDEERVTIFWEDDIEALKAKIDELLADENMGEAEKARLNEYKAQCDKLIVIIHTPVEYFSLRLFYFIWDLILWIWNSVVNAFSGLFGIQAIA